MINAALNETSSKDLLMKVVPTELQDTVLIEPKVFGDDRGFFLEVYHKQRFREIGIDAEFVQDNHSRSAKGILRGLHYQTEQTQGKLCRVVVGEVFDVAVDLRKSSPTYGQWSSVILSADNHRFFYVPPGFAHGFCVLSETAEFLYKCTDYYAPEHEVTIRWDDEKLGIVWPISDPLVSEKDAKGLDFQSAPKFD